MLKAMSEKYKNLLEDDTKHMWGVNILSDTSMYFTDYCDFCSFILAPTGKISAPFDWFDAEKIIYILSGGAKSHKIISEITELYIGAGENIKYFDQIYYPFIDFAFEHNSVKSLERLRDILKKFVEGLR